MTVCASCPREGEGRGLTSCSLSGQTTDDADDTVGHKSFISATVQTGFCDWSAKYFAQPVMKVTLGYLGVCFLSHGTAALRKRRWPERAPWWLPPLLAPSLSFCPGRERKGFTCVICSEELRDHRAGKEGGRNHQREQQS